MAQYTSNYNLRKPELTDSANITSGNDNWDIIDSELNELSNTKLDKPTTATDGNIAVFDTDQDAIKDSGYSPSDLINKMGSILGAVSTYKYFMPGWEFKTSTSLSINTIKAYYVPIVIVEPFTIVTIAVEHMDTTNSNLDVAIYSSENGLPTIKLSDTFTIVGGTTTGIKETTINYPVSSGIYFIGITAITNDFSLNSVSTTSSYKSPITALSNTINSMLVTSYVQTATSGLPTNALPNLVSTQAPIVCFTK